VAILNMRNTCHLTAGRPVLYHTAPLNHVGFRITRGLNCPFPEKNHVLETRLQLGMTGTRHTSHAIRGL
jgi:hypothetical protein